MSKKLKTQDLGQAANPLGQWNLVIRICKERCCRAMVGRAASTVRFWERSADMSCVRLEWIEVVFVIGEFSDEEEGPQRIVLFRGGASQNRMRRRIMVLHRRMRWCKTALVGCIWGLVD